MNLHGLASGVVGAVNPPVIAGYAASTGYTTGTDGTRTPSYGQPYSVYAQIQALTSSEIAQVENLTMQSVMRGIYLSGAVNGIVRPLAKGGDLITTRHQTWLVVQVLETWPDWSKVAVALQADITP
jgi:hypothetical protein